MKPIRPDELKLELYREKFLYSFDKVIQNNYNGKRVKIFHSDISQQLCYDHNGDVRDFFVSMSYKAFDGFLDNYRPYWNIDYKRPWWSDDYRIIMAPKEDYEYPKKT